MWIVRLALRRPYTFIVLSLVLLLGGVATIQRTPTDIFPGIDIPVISVVWTYSGLPSSQLEGQITQLSEYALAGNTGDLKSIESTTYDGTVVTKLFFQPGANIAKASAEVTAGMQAIMRRMPPGATPPVVVQYNASSVPILRLAFSSDTLTEAEIFDHVNRRVRTALSVVRGTRFPLPAGGKYRQVTVDLNLQEMRGRGISPNDVASAISAQTLILPSGNAKIGEREYRVLLNSTPEAIAAINDVPLKRIDGRQIYVRDVAYVHDGFQVQTDIARRDGKRAVVLSVMKTGDASTTEVAQQVRDMIPMLKAAAPPGMQLDLLADQSTYVTKSIHGLVTEGLIAAGLTAVLILLFLGSWRSTLIIAISIPLSVVSALIILRALGHNLNVMTLGGLALAVGILVDDATVEIENIHRQLGMGKPLVQAILDGAQEIAVPAFVASLSISVVFVSVAFLEGPARFLFLPMGMAVGLSVMSSYLLSRTLVPTLVRYLLAAEVAQHAEHGSAHDEAPQRRGLFGRVHAKFEHGFERFRLGYVGWLDAALTHRKRTIAVFVVAVAGAGVLFQFVGRDFFPLVDAGQVRMHIVAPAGTRIEETERWFSRAAEIVRREVPEQTLIEDEFGLPSGYTLAVSDSSTNSSADGDMLIVLSEHRKRSTAEIVAVLRKVMARELPELRVFFQPADIVTQILNFGVPSPIDVRIAGVNREATLTIARGIETELRHVPGAVDVRLHQILDAPALYVNVDRVRAAEAGLTQRDVANTLLLVVGSSAQVAPVWFLEPKSGISYPVVVQSPEHLTSTLDSLRTLALESQRGPQLLADLSRIERRTTPVFNTHSDLQPTFNVRADTANRELGGVTADIDKILEKYKKKLPPGASITLRGQADSMKRAFHDLAIGLICAALLVYAVMVINFQSWLDPFIIIMALPGAAIGMVLSLFATGTTLSIPSLMGAIMSIGVATANSILVVSFARERVLHGMTPLEAALEAGKVRLRPVVMTAMAMGIGMLPMSLGLSEGGEQNAALGRAVLGGLCGSTIATLFLVPTIYSLLGRKPRIETEPALADPDDAVRPPDHHAPQGASS